jgi:hypothetical protein
MKLGYSIFAAGCIAVGAIYSCSKSANPSPPVHDTTVVTKTDTLDVPPPPDPTVNLKMGLLLYLPFDGNIADSSGNGNPTTAVGGNGLTYDAHGYANNAFGSDGSGTRIKVTNNGSIKFDTAFSISYDVMINASQRQVFVSMLDPSTGNGPSFEVGASLTSIPNSDFYVNDVSASCDLPGETPPQNSASITDTSFVPQPGSWYNVICIYHQGTIQTYVNGVLNTTLAGPGNAALLCPNSEVVIGGWWDGDVVGLNGKLDEIRLYNRVLTPHEITTLAQNFQVTSEKVQPGNSARRTRTVIN